MTQQNPVPIPSAAGTRLESVDALRGFALIAIVLLHCVEHYNLYHIPEWEPGWLLALDSHVTQWMWALLAGKAYATFSLLFGFSFYIQMRNARRRGQDFRLRFAWRMVLLACFAQLHALFYNGDILLFYSVCGLVLIPASSLSSRWLLVISAILLLQPIDWAHIAAAAINPDYIDLNNRFAQFAVRAEQAAMHGSMLQVLADNIVNGQLYSNFWQVEAGRICQTPALFMLGMWAGRTERFVRSAASVRFWKGVLLATPVAYALFYALSVTIPGLCDNPTWNAHIGIALNMPANFALMAFYVAAFMLLWFKSGNGYFFQRLPMQFGRMSLTNYITQSIIGVSVFYGFGLGLWQYTGATLSTIIGLAIVTILTATSGLWLTHHRQGPLEALWKRLTWLGASTKNSAPAVRS